MSELVAPVSKNTTYAKKAGVLGFLFFLCKGLAWLALPAVLTYL